MGTKRRKFIQSGVMLSSGILLSGISSCKPKTESPIETQTQLSPMFDNIKPITKNDRLQRLEKARSLMLESGIDAIFLESGTSLEYFTGIKWWPSERMTACIVPKDGAPFYICPAFEEERLRELINIEGKVRVWQEHESPFNLVVNSLKDLGISSGRIGIEENVRFFLFDGIKNSSSTFEFVNAKPVVGKCRSIKTHVELELMRMANEITLQAYKIGFSSMEKGMSQYDFNKIVEDAFLALGATEKGWAGSSFGKYSAFPHGSSQPQSLKEGDIVLIDGGCKLEGYQADITRTTVFGEPTKRQKEIWNVVKEAQSAVYEHIEAGKPCESLDAVARSVVEKAGFGTGYTNFFHRVGHGIGMDFHEWEYLVKGNKTPLTPGMCFSNEPGIYLYDEFGVRLEDCFYVTEDGYKAFTPQSPSIETPV